MTKNTKGVHAMTCPILVRLTPIAAMLGLALLAPLPAGAQVQCGDVDANGSAADLLSCPTGTTASGIGHATNGNLTLVIPGAANLGTGGLMVNATGSDAVTLFATGTLSSSSGVQELVDIATDGGNILVDAFNITANSSTGTHGIRAITNTGTITLNTGAVSATSQANGVAGIEARIDNAGGASRNLTMNLGNVSGGGGHGILASVAGPGNVNITAGNVSVNTTATDPAVAAVEARANSGNVIMNLGNVTAIPGSSSGGTADTSNDYEVAAGIVVHSGNQTTITMNGDLASRIRLISDGRRMGSDGIALLATGGRVRLTMNGAAGFGGELGGAEISAMRRIEGIVDLSGVTGGGLSEITLNANTRWEVNNESVLSPGDDTINVRAGALLQSFYYCGAQTCSEGSAQGTGHFPKKPGSIDFGLGINALNLEGVMMIGGLDSGGSGDGSLQFRNRTDNEGRLHLINLTTFNMKGDLWLGADVGPDGPAGPKAIRGTDRWADDMLSMPGATWNSYSGSRVFLDVNFESGFQAGCHPDLYNAAGDLPAADCIDIRGGTVNAIVERNPVFGILKLGQTALIVSDPVPGDRGGYHPDGIVIVDVAGGTVTDPGAFMLDASSQNYTSQAGGAINKGLFIYPLVYDAGTQQFKLVSVPGAAGWQQPVLSTTAQTLWRTATSNWLNRETDLRDSRRKEGGTRGAWARGATSEAERRLDYGVVAAGNEVAINGNHDTRTWSTVLGLDLLGANHENSSWVAGAMLGYADGSTTFSQYGSSVQMVGPTFGVYGSFVTDRFFVDAVLNAGSLSVDQKVPDLLISTPESDRINTKGSTLGGQVEAGWRWMTGRFGLEPLASFSYVTSSFDEVKVASEDTSRIGNVISWEDNDSRRASLGLRLSYENEAAASKLRFRLALTGRAVNDSAAENGVVVKNAGQDALILDDFGGSFTEITAGVNLWNSRGSLAGFINTNVTTGDGFQSTGFAGGLRYQW